VQTLEDHSAFFASEAHRGELTFLLENGRRQRLEGLPNRSTGSFRDDLAFCLDALARAHCAVVFADLTTPDVRQFGLHVVRTLATGLQPIHFGHGAARLGGRRLYDVPARLGHGAGPRREQDLNPCPHPPCLRNAMLPVDDAVSLPLLYHLNSEPWLNFEAYSDPGPRAAVHASGPSGGGAGSPGGAP
jgi:hypothetical protein